MGKAKESPPAGGGEHGSYWGQKKYEQWLKNADPNYKKPKKKAPKKKPGK